MSGSPHFLLASRSPALVRRGFHFCRPRRLAADPAHWQRIVQSPLAISAWVLSVEVLTLTLGMTQQYPA